MSEDFQNFERHYEVESILSKVKDLTFAAFLHHWHLFGIFQKFLNNFFNAFVSIFHRRSLFLLTDSFYFSVKPINVGRFANYIKIILQTNCYPYKTNTEDLKENLNKICFIELSQNNLVLFLYHSDINYSIIHR